MPEYHRSWPKRRIFPGKAIPTLLHFHERYPGAKGYREKILLIDGLIHSFHWDLRVGLPNRSVANNLIEGSHDDVVRFLDRLSDGRLAKIEDGPKGFSGDVLSGEFRPRCGYLVESGDRKIEVIIKCGDPYEIEYLWEERYSGVSVSVRKRKIPGFRRGDDHEYKREFRFIAAPGIPP